jgi:hypothetical protein
MFTEAWVTVFMSATDPNGLNNFKRITLVRILAICKALFDFYVVDKPSVRVMSNGHGVSRASDFVVYLVEAEFIDKVVAGLGPCKCKNVNNFLLTS